MPAGRCDWWRPSCPAQRPLRRTPRAPPKPSTCFLDQAGQQACPTVLAPAELVPPATMQGLRPAAADALRAFQEQAIDTVLTRYDLPEPIGPRC